MRGNLPIQQKRLWLLRPSLSARHTLANLVMHPFRFRKLDSSELPEASIPHLLPQPQEFVLYPSHRAPAGRRPDKLGVFLALETSESTVQFPGRKGAPVIKHRGDVALPVEHRVQEGSPSAARKSSSMVGGNQSQRETSPKSASDTHVMPARAISVGTNTSLLGHCRMNGSEPMASRR